jgi:hypothetical protein
LELLTCRSETLLLVGGQIFYDQSESLKKGIIELNLIEVKIPTKINTIANKKAKTTG